MRVPMKVDYGVRALIELAQHERLEGPVTSAAIASRQGIPEPFLDHVLATFNRNGLIKSRSGPGGGHMLARPSHEISLAMVMETLDSNQSSLNCLDEPTDCIQYTVCTQRDVWKSVDQAIQVVLSSTSIGDLANKE